MHARTSGAASIVVSDVAACYPSIGETAIRAAARRSGGDPSALLTALARYREAGGDGIPIGPRRRRPIAEAVLALADERARIAGRLPVRWVDDVVFVGDPEAVHRAWRAWAAALAELGLREHEGKRSTSLSTLAGRAIVRRRRSPWHHARVVRSLYRARRVHTFGHPPAGEWVLVDGRHVERVGRRRPTPRRPCRRPPGRNDRARVRSTPTCT